MYTIVIECLDNSRRVIKPNAMFGTDQKGKKLHPLDVQDIARQIASDLEGGNIKSVTCERM